MTKLGADGWSDVAFAAVALFAEHLAVLRNGLAALDPRRDVVRLHAVRLAVLAAFFAQPLLPLVRLAFLTGREGPDVQMPLPACQNVRVDPLFVRNIVICV